MLQAAFCEVQYKLSCNRETSIKRVHPYHTDSLLGRVKLTRAHYLQGPDVMLQAAFCEVQYKLSCNTEKSKQLKQVKTILKVFFLPYSSTETCFGCLKEPS